MAASRCIPLEKSPAFIVIITWFLCGDLMGGNGTNSRRLTLPECHYNLYTDFLQDIVLAMILLSLRVNHSVWGRSHAQEMYGYTRNLNSEWSCIKLLLLYSRKCLVRLFPTLTTGCGSILSIMPIFSSNNAFVSIISVSSLYILQVQRHRSPIVWVQLMTRV